MAFLKPTHTLTAFFEVVNPPDQSSWEADGLAEYIDALKRSPTLKGLLDLNTMDNVKRIRAIYDPEMTTPEEIESWLAGHGFMLATVQAV